MVEGDDNTGCDIFLFGALGDLACKKLHPAFYRLESEHKLASDLKIYACARQNLTQNEFQQLIEQTLQKAVGAAFCQRVFARLMARTQYLTLDLLKIQDLQKLHAGTQSRRLFYFALPPQLYASVCDGLKQHELINAHTRVILEKPIGHNLDSSREINDSFALYFKEQQLYRIDHYLGKETVLNLLALRFANAIFAANWDYTTIDYVTISVAESVGVEGRWDYYDKAGQLRDMVQNHLLQILTLIAMEPPGSLDAESIRSEKLKVLKSLRPITASNCNSHCVRGQYTGGFIENKKVVGYCEEAGAVPSSQTETFIALRAQIDNWRWSGVPFYLRTGKRMTAKCSEVVIHFKPLVHNIFDPHKGKPMANQLILRLQPDEGICLKVMNKLPDTGSHMHLQNTTLDLSFKHTFAQTRIADAYERLLLEAIAGNQTWFVSREEVEHAWQWVDGIIDAFATTSAPLHRYESGTHGPDAVRNLFLKAEHDWND